MSIQSENKVYYRARRIADLLDQAFSNDSLSEVKLNKISRLLGEIEFAITGDRREFREER